MKLLLRQMHFLTCRRELEKNRESNFLKINCSCLQIDTMHQQQSTYSFLALDFWSGWFCFATVDAAVAAMPTTTTYCRVKINDYLLHIFCIVPTYSHCMRIHTFIPHPSTLYLDIFWHETSYFFSIRQHFLSLDRTDWIF